MKNIIQSLFILLIVVSATLYVKNKVRYNVSRDGGEYADRVKDLEYRSKNFLKDPLYRPVDLISNISGYDPDAPIIPSSVSQLRLGEVRVDSSYFDGIGNDVLVLNGKAIYGGEGIIELGPVFRKSEIELIFFTTQSIGTCCNHYRELSLIRHVNGIGMGIESLGVIHSGSDNEDSLLSRFSPKKNSLLIDLDVDELKRQFVEVKFNGGNTYSSEPLKYEQVVSEPCDFLWSVLAGYLNEVKSQKNEIVDIFEFSLNNLSNADRKTFTYLMNTQTGFDKENYIKIGKRIASEKFIHKNLRPTFNRQVCGN